jgi:hypothetical protein
MGEDNIKMDLKGIGFEGVYWIHLIYLFMIKRVISNIVLSTYREQKARQRCKESRGM